MFACLLVLATMAVAGDNSAQASVPSRQNSADRAILFIHGFDPLGQFGHKDCRETWGAAETAIEDAGWTGPLATFGLYAGTENCTYHYDGGTTTTIGDLGKALAWNIYNHYSVKGQPIDVIAHSMGGLVIRAAIAGVAAHYGGWPPYLYVEDVATLGTPHQGIEDAGWLGLVDNQQAIDMTPGSRFLTNLERNPQSAIYTDWTLIGSVSDTVADYTSEIDEGHDQRAHKIYYPKSDAFSHYDLRKVTTGSYHMVYRNAPATHWTTTSAGAAPVIAAKNAIYWDSAW